MSGKVEWCGNQSTDMSNMKSPIESKETVISNIPNQAPAVQPPSYEAYEAYEHQPGKELVRPVIVPRKLTFMMDQGYVSDHILRDNKYLLCKTPFSVRSLLSTSTWGTAQPHPTGRVLGIHRLP